MKHCNKCNIDTDSTQKYCPLCFNDLESDNSNSKKSEFYLTRTTTDTTVKTKYFLFRLFLFFSISTMVICAFINFMTYEQSGILWSLVVFASLLYVWILVGHNILSDRSIFEKIFFQFVGILGILLSTNAIASGAWLIKYVIPAVALTTAAVLILITLASKRRKDFVSTFFVIYVLLFVMSCVMVYAKFDTFKLINQINMLVCGLAILGSLIFGFRILKNDTSKKFHL